MRFGPSQKQATRSGNGRLNDTACFHTLAEDGILRLLAPGITARISLSFSPCPQPLIRVALRGLRVLCGENSRLRGPVRVVAGSPTRTKLGTGMRGCR